MTWCFSGREFFLTESVANIQKIISFLQYEKSVIRRGAAALVLRNCDFSYGNIVVTIIFFSIITLKHMKLFITCIYLNCIVKAKFKLFF